MRLVINKEMYETRELEKTINWLAADCHICGLTIQGTTLGMLRHNIEEHLRKHEKQKEEQ